MKEGDDATRAGPLCLFAPETRFPGFSLAETRLFPCPGLMTGLFLYQ